MPTERINRELATLAEKYLDVTTLEEPNGWVNVIISALPIPAGFTSDTARILVRIPPLYPGEKLDLFWLTPNLSRVNGVQLPNIMQPSISYANEVWKQISWHDNSPHDANRISILGFVRGIVKWFEGQK